MRALFLSDVHIATRSPRSRKDNFYEAILAKLSQIGEIARKKNVHFVSIAGDLFHYKSPSDNTFQCVNDLADIFRSYKCPILTIPGNHDLLYDNYEYINRQPYGTLIRTGAIVNVLESPMVLSDENNFKATVRGFNYDRLGDVNNYVCSETEGFTIGLLHVGASPEGGSFFGIKLLAFKEIAAASKLNVFHIGHLHQQYGVVQVDGKWFISTGSVSRGTSHYENIVKMPCVAYVEFDGSYFKPWIVRLKVRPAADIFDLTQLSQEKKVETEFKVFDALEKASVSTDPIKAVLDSMELSDTVRELVTYYLEMGENNASSVI